jgi:hypothetical protein
MRAENDSDQNDSHPGKCSSTAELKAVLISMAIALRLGASQYLEKRNDVLSGVA